MVDKYQPAEEKGIEFDLDGAQAANEAVEQESAVAAQKPSTDLKPSTSLKPAKPPGAIAKFFADDGLFMRFAWWTARTVASFLIPLCMFYVLQRNPQLVDGAYKMIKPGIEPYPVLLRGGMAATIAVLLASVPPLFGVWLASVLYSFKSLKPLIAFSVWFIAMFFFTTIFVVAARYFRII